jgi:hypothetical protein
MRFNCLNDGSVHIMERKNPGINDVRLLGVAFIRWGLGLFIFGLIIGCSPLVHYLQGVLERMGETTLQNAALWLASPYTVQIGALGMVAIGAVYGLLPADKLQAESRDYTALWLCVTGLAAIFVTGYLGYFMLNAIWGTYYKVPPTLGEKNVVVIAVGLSAALYLIGVVLAYLSIFHITDYKVQRS